MKLVISSLFATLAGAALTACGSAAVERAGADTLTQTTYFNASIANCAQQVTLPSGTKVERRIELTAIVRQNGGQKTPVGLKGLYSEFALNSGDFNHFHVDFAANNGDFFRVVSADSNFVDVSTAGTATLNVEGDVSEYLLSAVFLDTAKNSVALQLKDEAADSTAFSVTCPAAQKLSNVWLFKQPHVVGR